MASGAAPPPSGVGGAGAGGAGGLGQSRSAPSLLGLSAGGTVSSSTFGGLRSPSRAYFPASPTRLPREGPSPGGGLLKAHDRRLLEKYLSDVDNEGDEEVFSPSRSPTKGRGASPARSTRSARSLGSEAKNLRKENSATAALKEVIPLIAEPIAARVASRQPIPGNPSLDPNLAEDVPGSAAQMTSPTARGASASASPKKRSGPRPKRPPSPPIGLERKLEDLFARAHKEEVKLDQAQAAIRQRLFRLKELRDERFKRLLNVILAKGEDNFAHVCAMAIREFDDIEHARQMRLFTDWEDQVYNRIADQAYRHLNPPDRVKEQAATGTKSVQWKLPDEHFKLKHNLKDDPVKKGWVTGDEESAFHRAAQHLLGKSQSAPSLGTFGPGSPQGSPCMAKPVTKPIMEPTDWHPQRVMGTMYGGHLAQAHQAMALGMEARRQKRGGAGVHLQDHETDAVESAGTRICRVNGHMDRGILKGEIASRGETSLFKAHHGTSSGAPAQDHFNPPTGTEVTTLEFPPGKRSGYAVQRLS